MPLRHSLASMATLSLSMAMSPAAARCQSVPLQQPGAPGQASKTLRSTVGTAVREPTKADIEFMQGMVMHHSQAVEMVGLMQDHTKSPALLDLGKRIRISQGDEIIFMKRWLAFYNHPVVEDSMAGMPGMEHMDHMQMDMPGMLTPQQMETLRKAKGPQFDHLFLTGMIQHHTGALTMVKDLFATQGSGQEPQLFDFTADVDVTQRGEIDTMQTMLAKENQ